MNIGAVILARMTSTRLPGKGLKNLNGKPVLEHIVDKLLSTNIINHVVIATSIEKEDDPLEVFCKRRSIKCYRGSLHNVAERFLGAAIKNDFDFAIRINGDNLFVNTELIDESVSMALGGIDFVSNVPNRTYPKGMSVEVIKVDIFKSLFPYFTSNDHFEHVTMYLYENIDKINHYFIENNTCPMIAGRQIAIDTQYDFELASKVLNKCRLNLNYNRLDELNNIFNKCENEMNFVGKHGPLLIAEIGGNHEGDFEYARRLTELAIESDSDFIKFQIYSGNTLVNLKESPDRHKHFKKFELSREQYRELALLIINSGKRFMASIWDIDMIEWVDEFNPIYKIGSGDLLAWPLLKYVAKKSKPLIISTGLATEEEVLSTIKFIQKCNPLYEDSNYLSVLQCTSMYPIPASSANLSVMLKIKELTKLTVGYSDHTEGSEALRCAIAMGAQVIEYHFTDTRHNKDFRDHKVSLTKNEVLELIEYIKKVNILNGDSQKRPTAIELDHDHVVSFRRGVYPARDIRKGEVIKENDLVILRPEKGISSRLFYDLIGLKARESLKKNQVLEISLFENID